MNTSPPNSTYRQPKPPLSLDQIRDWHSKILSDQPLIDFHDREAQAHNCIAVLLKALHEAGKV